MRSVRLLSSALLSIMLAHTPVWAGIYKWVDENGQVHYGERPVSQGAERMQVETRRSAPVEQQQQADTTSESESTPKAIPDGKPRRLMRNPSGPPEVITETVKGKPGKPAEVVEQKISGKEKRRRCRDARSRLQSIQQRARMKETDEKGNVRALTPRERSQRIRQAQKRIRENCR